MFLTEKAIDLFIIFCQSTSSFSFTESCFAARKEQLHVDDRLYKSSQTRSS